MISLLMIAEESKTAQELCRGLAQKGYACSIVPDNEEAIGRVAEEAPDLVLVESSTPSRLRELSHRIKQERNLPIIALVQGGELDNINGHLDLVDDFAIQPYDLVELVLRVSRLLHRAGNTDSSDVVRHGDLVIDLARCEVSVAGRPVMLTFKEYELLKFLASNKGRVFTREALLNKVWGYDYYGGDRTVDVHITRLRSKIEDSTHTFIETVRNIGYRLQADV